jgi:hypothetical protein
MPIWRRRRRGEQGTPSPNLVDPSARYGIQQFDNVRIVRTPETESLGFAGETGSCHGFTTPSITGVEVVGGDESDLAFNVHFGENDAWFAPELVEFVDHAPGSTISIGDRTFVRTKDGAWIDQDTGETAT